MTKSTVSKGARLILLRDLRIANLLEGLTLQEIGDALGVNRSTILRDLRDLDAAEAEYRRLMATQPWLHRDLSTTEFAELTGWEPDTVRAMIRDGLIKVRDVDGFYRIPREELQRWRMFTE
jgi:excisionase family DNA binding protein